MNECVVCGSVETLPFTCNECGQTLCSRHRLPEAHDCPVLASDRVRFGQQPAKRRDPESPRRLTSRLKRLALTPLRVVESLFK